MLKTIIRLHATIGKIDVNDTVTEKIHHSHKDDELNALLEEGYQIAEIVNIYNDNTGVLFDVIYLFKTDEDDDDNGSMDIYNMDGPSGGNKQEVDEIIKALSNITGWQE